METSISLMISSVVDILLSPSPVKLLADFKQCWKTILLDIEVLSMQHHLKKTPLKWSWGFVGCILSVIDITIKCNKWSCSCFINRFILPSCSSAEGTLWQF